MKQITIVAEDHPGVMAEVAEAMATAGVNIETLDAETFGGSGVIILTVDRYDTALRALARTPYKAVSEDAIVIQLDDKPGELARVTRRFKEAGINLQSVRILRRDAASGKTIVAVSTPRTEEAVALLKDEIIS